MHHELSPPDPTVRPSAAVPDNPNLETEVRPAETLCHVSDCPGHDDPRYPDCVTEALHWHANEFGDTTGSADHEGQFTLIAFDHYTTLPADDHRSIAIPSGTYLIHEDPEGRVRIIVGRDTYRAQSAFDAAITRHSRWLAGDQKRDRGGSS